MHSLTGNNNSFLHVPTHLCRFSPTPLTNRLWSLYLKANVVTYKSSCEMPSDSLFMRISEKYPFIQISNIFAAISIHFMSCILNWHLLANPSLTKHNLPTRQKVLMLTVSQKGILSFRFLWKFFNLVTPMKIFHIQIIFFAKKIIHEKVSLYRQRYVLFTQCTAYSFQK